METIIVYKDVENSPYKEVYSDICFHFSSLFNLRRYKTNIEKFVNEEELKIRNKYQLEIDMKKYLAIAYYKKIEKRGFYALIENNDEFNEINYINVVEIKRR